LSGSSAAIADGDLLAVCTSANTCRSEFLSLLPFILWLAPDTLVIQPLHFRVESAMKFNAAFSLSAC
jgi:hypothetical protein